MTVPMIPAEQLDAGPAGEAILGANPFVGLSPRQAAAALGRVLLRFGARPRLVARHTGRLARDLAPFSAPLGV